jgi:hypothetical protein
MPQEKNNNKERISCELNGKLKKDITNDNQVFQK